MNIRKLFALSMSVVAGLTCMGGCGGGKENKDALLISVFDGGYGTKWATDIAAAFEEKTGIQTEVKPSTYVDGFRTALESGTTEADLFFGKKAHWDLFYKEVKVGSQKFKPIFADLTDIYTSVIPGEDKTIREKLSPDVADLLNFGTEEEPLYYTYSWAIGDMGIVVNNKDRFVGLSEYYRRASRSLRNRQGGGKDSLRIQPRLFLLGRILSVLVLAIRG